MDGPCSHLKRNNVVNDNDFLRDHERVKYIQSRIFKNNNLTELDSSVSIPTIPGLPLSTLNYIIVIRLGTPENSYQMVFDTGSSLTWTQCYQCKTCYEQSDARFNPLNSSTYKGSVCSDKTCKGLMNTRQGKQYLIFNKVISKQCVILIFVSMQVSNVVRIYAYATIVSVMEMDHIAGASLARIVSPYTATYLLTAA